MNATASALAAPVAPVAAAPFVLTLVPTPAPAPAPVPAPATRRVPAQVEIPKAILTGRYTSSLGLRMIGWVAPELAERALSSVQAFVERVGGPIGGMHRVVSR